jgi:cell wall-associated NlpC family hydrolase
MRYLHKKSVIVFSLIKCGRKFVLNYLFSLNLFKHVITKNQQLKKYTTKLLSTGIIFLIASSIGTASTTNISVTPIVPPAATLKERLVNLVHKTIDNVHYTAYKWGGSHFDPSKGVYIVDCSNYVDHLLQTTCPRAYRSLVNSSGSTQPTSRHYYNFFTQLSTKHPYNWDKVQKVDHLRPGDILVFRYQQAHGTARVGHVMVVMNKPVRQSKGYLVRVADSASIGHTHDTRLPYETGIGMGTLLLKVNQKNGQPSAYAWTIGSNWKRNVKFAMARPIDTQHIKSNV